MIEKNRTPMSCVSILCPRGWPIRDYNIRANAESRKMERRARDQPLFPFYPTRLEYLRVCHYQVTVCVPCLPRCWISRFRACKETSSTSFPTLPARSDGLHGGRDSGQIPDKASYFAVELTLVPDMVALDNDAIPRVSSGHEVG